MTRPRLSTASTISGSGLFQREAGCRPTAVPKPTEESGWALVNTSASGPMPTSMYWDQAPRACRACLRAIASSDPGVMRDRSVPIIAWSSLRSSVARAGSPPACSSMTRSSRLTAKVTPQAFTAWRSQGASR